MGKIRSLITTTLLSGVVFFTSCKKERSCEGCINGDEPPVTDTLHVPLNTPNPTVYIAGYEYNGSYVAKKYWKNGVSTTLLTVDDAFLSGIAVSGNDVYVSGYEKNESNYVAKYWKNGIPIALTNGNCNAHTTGIAVVGSDVYVVGYEYHGQRRSAYDEDSNLYYYNDPIAKYWKNGIPVFLSDTSHASHARDIAVVGTDVYVAGEANGKIQYWKNGNSIPLPANSLGAVAIAMAISGSDVYVLGYDGNSITGRLIVKYWKNGNPVVLGDGSQSLQISDIAVSGSDVYISGWEYNGTKNVGKYWKNGIPIVLAGNVPEPQAISVIGGDVYVTGRDAGVSQNIYGWAAKYWKNGSVVALNDGTQWSYTIGITVTQ